MVQGQQASVEVGIDGGKLAKVESGTDEKGNNENDYILNEEGSVGEFTKGEVITGQTSGETATILAEDTDSLQIYISANSKFVTGETITGGTSGAQGVVSKYRANPNETLSQILEYADVNDCLLYTSPSPRDDR